VNDPKPSKSARKREVIALQALGEQLIDLSNDQLSAIDTDAQLIEHVLAAKKIQSHGALRRQKQLIGKIMRNIDPEPIRQALSRFAAEGKVSNALFKEAEQWRDRIANNSEQALSEFSSATGCASATLTSCVAELHSAHDARRQKHARRALFREVHRLLMSKMHSTTV